MVVSDVTKYKNKIKNKLFKISDAITLLNNKDISITTPDKYYNVNIFPYIKIPKTTLEAKNYICYDYSSRTLSANDTYKSVTINVVAVCHESELVISAGCRHDSLGGVLIENLNHSDFLGFELELISDEEKIWDNGYYVRWMVFKNLTQNSMVKGVRRN